MADPHSTPSTGSEEDRTDDQADAEAASDADEEADLEALRREVEEKYDFEEFGPAQMAEMTVEEWQAAFDHETWITGDALLDRVADDLRSRVATREVFARIERHDRRLLAYSDEGYAVVYPDGSVEGEGTVLRDVKPSVALCSMESYDVPEPPEDAVLPRPQEVPEGSGELGNRMLQAIAGAQILAGLALLGGAVLFIFGGAGGGGNAILLVVAGIAFLVIGVLLFMVVANARLSDKFRAEEYRNRLRAVGLEGDDRPEFVPPMPGEDGADDGRPEDEEADDGLPEEGDGDEDLAAGDDGSTVDGERTSPEEDRSTGGTGRKAGGSTSTDGGGTARTDEDGS